jgi:hypothetical protein
VVSVFVRAIFRRTRVLDPQHVSASLSYVLGVAACGVDDVGDTSCTVRCVDRWFGTIAEGTDGSEPRALPDSFDIEFLLAGARSCDWTLVMMANHAQGSSV